MICDDHTAFLALMCSLRKLNLRLEIEVVACSGSSMTFRPLRECALYVTDKNSS